MKESVEYFAFVVNAEGIHPSPRTTQAILEVAEPNNVTELQSFLGLVNYYRKFIPNMSTLVNPFNQLLAKNSLWNWNEDCQHAFVKLKETLVSTEVLVHYDPEKPVCLATDASSHGLGAVLSHRFPNGEEKPIAYASRSLTAAEKNYSQIEKEALAIIFGIQKFHVYLYGRKFQLWTDHEPLVMMFGAKKGIPVLAASRLQRWAIKLSSYLYEIHYKSTKCNGNADALSRLPLEGQSEAADEDLLQREATLMNIVQINSVPVTPGKIRLETEHDPVLSRVVHFTMHGWPHKDELTSELLPYFKRKDELTIEEGCLLWGIRVIIPGKLRSEVSALLHDNHPGIVRMKSLARLHVWWPDIDQLIEQTVRNCEACQAVRTSAGAFTSNPWTWPSKPWQRIHIDYAEFKNVNFLIVIDAHSKWPEILQMCSTTAERTINALRYLFASHGLPEQLVSDNGPQFIAKEFKTFMKMNGIKHILSSPYHPSSNGEAERNVRTFKQALKKFLYSTGVSLNEKLASFLLSYRTTPHTTTGCTPAEMFVGRRLRTRLNLLRPQLANKIEKKSSPVKGHPRVLEVGDQVQVRDYRQGSSRWSRGVITQKLGPVTYRVQVGNLIWKRHIDQILDMSTWRMKDFEETNQPDEQIVSTPALKPSPVPEISSCESACPEGPEEEEQVDSPAKKLVEDTVPEGTMVRKSDRVSRPPGYLKDYV